VQAILDNGIWPSSLRDIDTGLTTITGLQEISGSLLSQLEAVAEAELGLVFVDVNGNLVFRQRYAALTRTLSNTSQATFTASSADSLPFMSVDLVYDDNLVKTQVKTSSKGSSQTTTIQDGAAAALYGVRSENLTDLLVTSDDLARDIGDLFLTLYAEAEFRPQSITVKPDAKPDSLYPQVLGRELRDRVTVQFTTPGGIAQSLPCFVDAVEHRITPGTWTTTLGLASTTVWDQMFVLDSSTSGYLDVNILGA
jgi:hypothetical protein